MNTKNTFTCPSCGFKTFSAPPGSYDICPICNWEDDHVQLVNPGLRGGANGGSLKEYQDDILKEHPLDVKEVDGFIRDPDWRPLKEKECIVKDTKKGTGVNYFTAACNTEASYYWKR